MSQAYTLKHERFGHAPGTVVYEARMHDYGCASDDTRQTGIEHVSVTLKPDGGYPFFTVPRYYLKQVWCCEKAKAQNVAVCQDCANSGQLSAWLEKTRKASEVANAPIAFTDGNAEAAWIEQSRGLNCPACGGSGHVDDTVEIAKAAARWQRFKRMTRVMSLDMGGQHVYATMGEFMRLRGPTLDAAMDALLEKEAEGVNHG